MYLKSLQVVGFKSFADRTTLQFHRGVTAIVGPNGCGKSNVLDSIRWVLGEQSAKALRGGEMKDVIFSGTDTRPPLGMAEVSLTFAECEHELGTSYHEVTITRRVFRDGASEYEINGTTCRLRDIHSLFMDTGIGRSAYSIMEQGKIDLILSSRPEDRRAIFEEAAGITKYKSQKKEAMRKLENTEVNLVRLADIIREVKRQIGSLQRQAGKAKRYQASFAELGTLEHKLARRKFDLLSAILGGLQREVESAREKHEQLSGAVTEQETKVQEARQELAQVETELVRLREEQNVLRSALELAQQRATINRARVEEFSTLGNQARLEIAATEEKVHFSEGHLAELTAQVERYQETREQTQLKFDAEQDALHMITARISTVSAELAELEEQKTQQQRLGQRHEQELVALDLQKKNFQNRRESLHQDRTALTQRHEEACRHASGWTERLAAAEKELAEKKAALQAVHQARQAAEEKLRGTEKQHQHLLKTQQNLLARRDALAQLEERQVSAPQAAQRLIREAAKNGLPVPETLSRQLVVQAGYERPLSLLLGDAVNALVLGDEAEAQAWRARLAQAEQCAFAPRRAARPVPLPSGQPTHAARYLTAQPAVQDILAALLEDAHVVETLEDALALKLAQPQSTVATRTGELLTRSGLLLVGQETGASLTVLTRQTELRQLQESCEVSGREVSTFQAALETAQTVHAGYHAEHEQGRTTVQEAEIALATHRQEERAAQSARAQAQQQMEDLARELARLQAQEESDHARHESLRVALLGTTTEQGQAQEKTATLKTQLAELAAREATQANALTELRIELANQSSLYDASQQQREPVVRRLQEVRELVDLRTREALEHEKRVEQARAEITQAEAESTERNGALQSTGDFLTTAQHAKAEVQGRIAEQEVSLRTLRRDHGELQAARAAREIRLAEEKHQLTSLRESIRRNYQKDLEELEALTEADAALDWAAVETETVEKRAVLDALGPVNLEAITEYEELEQRQQFLLNQENDLLQAKEQLLLAIKEINQTTQKLFAETFEQVRKNFQEMFTELFGGGKATLNLLDANDPLECGIEIVAKPPGKQLQSVTLLSGGEKTMTAVALLFAIYLVKPSPFCVLDEMDAPLDESNINRFIKILQRFVHQSQFVVITHNKRTISIADVLYGVTMEERGVSRFVSMRLTKRENSVLAKPGTDREEGVPSLAESVVGAADEIRT